MLRRTGSNERAQSAGLGRRRDGSAVDARGYGNYRVDAAVAADGCDHTLAATDSWAVEEGIDLERLHEGLEEYGGYCDCEVLMNVDAAGVFTPVRTPRG